MRNWHTKVIKLDKAKEIIAQNQLQPLGNPNLYVGVMEGSIEYTEKDKSKLIYENNNYEAASRHLENDTCDKVIFRKQTDDNFYDDNLTQTINDRNPLTHTTSVAGIIAGTEKDDYVSGICPNINIINNASTEFENALILAGVNEYSKSNIGSEHYNEIIKDQNGKPIVGGNYFTQKTIPNGAIDKTNLFSQKKSAIINCSFTWSNNPLNDKGVTEYMPAEITDFVMKELFAYGRDGRGVLTVFAAGNESENNPQRPFTLSNKPLIVAASRVTLDDDKLDVYTSDNPIPYVEDKATYSNSGKRIDICAPSSPTGMSGAGKLEIYAPTMMNSGEIGENEDQIFSTTVLKRQSSSKLILTDLCNGIFPGQSIEIGDPTTFFHEVRFITKVETIQEPVDQNNPKQNLRTMVTLDASVEFTDEWNRSNPDASFTIIGKTVKICVFKKKATLVNQKELKLDDMNGIGKNQSQKIYIYSGNDILNGQQTEIDNNDNEADYKNNIIHLKNPINFPSTVNLTLIPGQIYAKLKRYKPRAERFIPADGSSLKGFFTGQQVYINEVGINRHIKYVNKSDYGYQLAFSQFKSVSDEVVDASSDEFTIKSLAYGNLTSSFGGTSAAAPIATGVSALLLSVNPDLNAAEIKHILKDTADQIGGVNYNDAPLDATKYNYGYNTHDNFGAGRVNAEAAVALALKWHDLDHLPSTDWEVQKPKLAVRDTDVLDVNGNLKIIPDNEPVDSPHIWIKPSRDTSADIPATADIFTSVDQTIYVRVKNTGNRQSFKECDLRVLIAFTNEENPAFPFPAKWYDQSDVKLLSVKEIPIIPANSETVIKIEWKDIAKNWEQWNPERKKAYILAHIAPFDGLFEIDNSDPDNPINLSLTNIRKNKQLTCKPIRVIHRYLNQPDSPYIPGNKFNFTVGTELVSKSFDLSMENVATTDLEELQIKATIKYKPEKNIPDETVTFTKINGDWSLDKSPSENWIKFETPTIETTEDPNYSHAVFPHTLTVNHDEQEVKLEIV